MQLSKHRTPLHVVLCAVMLINLVGCGSMKPLPGDTFYRLTIEPGRPAHSDGSRWTEKSIRVAKFQASGLHRERAIAYSEQDQVVVKQHRYHLWIDSPERMLQNELISYLRAAGVAPVISASELAGEGFEVRGQIRQMDQVIDGIGGVKIVVVLAFELVSKGSGKALILGREYRESHTVPNSDIKASAVAISGAIGVIFARFAADAGNALRK
jgi:ABC-type uncharacterized transport system auxiliary subunit